MSLSAAITLVLALATVAAGCGASGPHTEGISAQAAIQTGVLSAAPILTAASVKRVRFLEAFDIGHPLKAGEGIHVFVLGSQEEEAALLDGFDAVTEAIDADFATETLILVTFTANVITREEEYSLKATELTTGRGGHIEILYTVTPGRGYAESECPYYAIIVIPKTDIPASGITVEIING
jgi:hypothetical protein